MGEPISDSWLWLLLLLAVPHTFITVAWFLDWLQVREKKRLMRNQNNVRLDGWKTPREKRATRDALIGVE